MDPEKAQYGYDSKAQGYNEDGFVHGHATVAAANGVGGDTHRGLKSRHIQFLALGGAIGTGKETLYMNIV